MYISTSTIDEFSIPPGSLLVKLSSSFTSFFTCEEDRRINEIPLTHLEFLFRIKDCKLRLIIHQCRQVECILQSPLKTEFLVLPEACELKSMSFGYIGEINQLVNGYVVVLVSKNFCFCENSVWKIIISINWLKVFTINVVHCMCRPVMSITYAGIAMFSNEIWPLCNYVNIVVKLSFYQFTINDSLRILI